MPLSMLRTRSILNSNRDCGNYYEVFNRIDWRLKTFIGFLQYTLHSGIDLRFIPNSCFSGGEYGAHFARTLADVGKMWGKFEERKIAKPLVFKGLAIVCRVELVPLDVLFSNQFLHDLDLIWELHEFIPDPSNPRLVIDK